MRVASAGWLSMSSTSYLATPAEVCGKAGAATTKPALAQAESRVAYASGVPPSP